MSACRRYRERLIDDLDGTLAAPDAGRLRDHLDRCPACAKAREDLRRSRDRVRSLPPVEPPPWLEDRILVRIHTGQAPRRKPAPRWLRPALPAAALLLFGFTGYLVLRRPGGPTAPAEAKAEAGPPAPARPAGPASGVATQPTGPAPGAPAKAARPAPASAPSAAAPQAVLQAAPQAVPQAGAPAGGASAPGTPAFAPAPTQASPARPEVAERAAPAPAPPAVADKLQAAARADRRAPAGELAAPAAGVRAKSAPAITSLALSWEPGDSIRAASRAQAAFEAAGATILSRPGPDYRGITARVPGPALDALLERLQAMGPLPDAPPRPTRLRGEVLVTMTW
jgi:hypothetical protein